MNSGSDVVTDFVSGTDKITMGTGVAGGTLMDGAATAVAAAGNFAILGQLTGSTFIADSKGPDTLLFTATAALGNVNKTGTNLTVLENTKLTVMTDIVA